MQSAVDQRSQRIESEFRALDFTQNPGYKHYAPTDKDADLRKISVNKFLSEQHTEEPHLEPSRYSREAIEEAVGTYDRLLMELASNPARTPEEDLLMDKIINKTGELFRYEELLLSLGSVALEGRDEHRRLASELSLEIMGGIDQVAFDALVGELYDMANNSELPVGAELKALLGERKATLEAGFSHIELEDATRDVIKNDLYALFPGLGELAEEESSGPVGLNEAVTLFKDIQQLAGMGDWYTKLSAGESADTSGKDKTVYIGRGRDSFESRKDAVALGVHEAIVHGGRSRGVQAANTLDFEEGLATRLQQVISGEERTPGVQYYLSIGLQAGADREGEVRNFRDTFEIMWRREVLLQEKAGKEVKVPAARALAQRQVTRTRRGGAIDTRDSSYFVGAQKAASWLNYIATRPLEERRQALQTVLFHRIDPTVPGHVATAESWGGQGDGVR